LHGVKRLTGFVSLAKKALEPAPGFGTELAQLALARVGLGVLVLGSLRGGGLSLTRVLSRDLIRSRFARVLLLRDGGVTLGGERRGLGLGGHDLENRGEQFLTVGSAAVA
jgi:hypothetical protein